MNIQPLNILLSNLSIFSPRRIVSNFNSTENKIFIVAAMIFGIITLSLLGIIHRQRMINKVTKSNVSSKEESKNEIEFIKIKNEFEKLKDVVTNTKNEIVSAKNEIINAKVQLIDAKDEFMNVKEKSITQNTLMNVSEDDDLNLLSPITLNKTANKQSPPKQKIEEADPVAEPLPIIEKPAILLEFKIDQSAEINNLPKNTHVLDLSECEDLGIEDIAKLPQNLIKLELNCADLSEEELENLPSSIEELVLHNCHKLTTLNFLNHNLRKLKLINWSEIEVIDLGKVAPKLEEFEIFDAANFTHFSSVPPNLIKINLFDCPEIKKLNFLPVHLQELNLGGCCNIKNIKHLPKNLQILNFDNNINSDLDDFIFTDEMVKDLPPHLKELRITPCNLTFFDQFPQKLKKLTLAECSYLTSKQLGDLPNTIEELEIEGVGHNEDFKYIDQLPQGLKKFSCCYFPYLEKIAIQNQLDLHTLKILSLPKLTQINWPNSLKELEIEGCSLFNNENFKNFPEQIEKLFVGNISSLTALNHLPKGLKELNVSTCPSLINIIMPSKLEDCSLIGFQAPLKIDSISKELRKFCFSGTSLIAFELKTLSKLEKLDFSYCTDLSKLMISHSEKLKQLYFYSCTELKSIDLTKFPELEELVLMNCSKLVTIVGMPEKLRILNVMGCSSLEDAGLPALPDTIEDVNVQNTQIKKLKMKNHADIVNP